MRETAWLGTTQSSFDIAAKTTGRLLRIDISDSTVWRHHKEVTSQLETHLETEECEVPHYVALKDVPVMSWIAPQNPIETHTSVSLDGVKILTREERWREVTIVSVSEVVADPKEVTRDTEEATAATDEDGRRQDGLKLTEHSYRAILGEKPEFIPALKGELARRRVWQAEEISSVNDGADWIWDLVARYLPERCTEILDWPHAVENLAKAGKAGWGEGTAESQAWLEERKAELWNGQLVQVEIGLENLPKRYKERGIHIRQVKAYIDRHWSRLQYDIFRSQGRPIGSGTVESAARNVVTWRMKRGGRRWSIPGARRMLAAVGEVHSNRWDTQMQHLAKAA